jgi:multidrug efflux pump subunit AcrA (membrane-fusion protein)
MLEDDDYWDRGPRFTSLQKNRLPRVLLHIGWVIIAFILLSVLILIFTPWIQTTSGFGQMTAIDPSKRQHELHTLVDGRIDQWFVQDGDHVKANDPIVSILDNDPKLVERLNTELDALESQLKAAELAAATAELDYQRRKTLRDEGLASQREYEQARIKVQQLRAAQSNARALLARGSVEQTQQTQQRVVAPSDGTIIQTADAAASTYVRRGDKIAMFLPDNSEPAVELFITGRDIPLIQPGRKVRLVFDGWPAVQFSGWPSVAIGTFGGVVKVVEATARPNGLFRIFVVPDPDDQPWPGNQFLRFGAKARGWVLLDQVPLGYELWRVLNQFPPNFVPGSETNAMDNNVIGTFN